RRRLPRSERGAGLVVAHLPGARRGRPVTARGGVSDAGASPRPLWLLAAGVALGLACAALGLLRGAGAGGRLPADAVATVDGEPRPTDEYERVLGAFGADPRAPP